MNSELYSYLLTFDELNKDKTVETKATDPYTRGKLEVSYKTNSSYKGVDLFSTNLGNKLEFDPWGKPYNSLGDLDSNGEVILLYLSELRTIVICPNTGNVKIE